MRIVRLILLGSLAVGLVAGAALAGSHDDPIVVIDVGDPMDQRSIDYVVDVVQSERAHLYILKIDSPGVSSGDISALYEAIVESPAPVISWIGPYPAVAYGGAAFLASYADIRAAAPGSMIGYLDPAVQRGNLQHSIVGPVNDPDLFRAEQVTLADSAVAVTVEDPVVLGFVDRVDPALGQLIASLDGTTVSRGSEVWEISTAGSEVVDGQSVIVSTRTVKFMKPGLVDRFLRLGARPETAFLFLLIGAAFAVFEFYAAGRGLMAAVASMSLLVAGYGLATLPIWWPALIMILVGLGIVVWGFAQNRVDWRAVVGVALLLVAGLMFTTTRPAYPPAAWMVILAVAASVVFIWYSLTTVVRGRFATPTFGREGMLGKRCLAVSDLDPEGVVMVDGARWRATVNRGIVVGAGGGVDIVGITGLVLEVDPVATAGREEIL